MAISRWLEPESFDFEAIEPEESKDRGISRITHTCIENMQERGIRSAETCLFYIVQTSKHAVIRKFRALF